MNSSKVLIKTYFLWHGFVKLNVDNGSNKIIFNYGISINNKINSINMNTQNYD